MSTESIKIQSANVAVAIAPDRGAIVTSFRCSDRELLYLDEATLNDRSKNVRGGIPVLFPAPGKLVDDRWAWGGRKGELKQHGFARNLAWHTANQARDRVRLELEASPATLSSYPWQFHAGIEYSVRPNALAIDVAVTNRDTTTMPCALGFHPYFLVTDKARASIETLATRAFDNLTKHIAPFAGFDFTHGEVDMHLLDHRLANASLTLAGTHEVALTCSSQFVRWVVWTLPARPFICLEPWTAPGNALNTRDGLSCIEPGQTEHFRVEIAAREMTSGEHR